MQHDLQTSKVEIDTSRMELIWCFQVEPQEKKKTPKGRAKKRITYTRRFVNVTMTGGKRKVSCVLHFSHSKPGHWWAIRWTPILQHNAPFVIGGWKSRWLRWTPRTDMVEIFKNWQKDEVWQRLDIDFTGGCMSVLLLCLSFSKREALRRSLQIWR